VEIVRLPTTGWLLTRQELSFYLSVWLKVRISALRLPVRMLERSVSGKLNGLYHYCCESREASKAQFWDVCQRILLVVGTGGVASTSPVLELRPLCRVVSVGLTVFQQFALLCCWTRKCWFMVIFCMFELFWCIQCCVSRKLLYYQFAIVDNSFGVWRCYLRF